MSLCSFLPIPFITTSTYIINNYKQHFSHGELNHAHHTDSKLVLVRACLGLYPFKSDVRRREGVHMHTGGRGCTVPEWLYIAWVL
jgi:hypothetical protein